MKCRHRNHKQQLPLGSEQQSKQDGEPWTVLWPLWGQDHRSLMLEGGHYTLLSDHRQVTASWRGKPQCLLCLLALHPQPPKEYPLGLPDSLHQPRGLRRYQAEDTAVETVSAQSIWLWGQDSCREASGLGFSELGRVGRGSPPDHHSPQLLRSGRGECIWG